MRQVCLSVLEESPSESQLFIILGHFFDAEVGHCRWECVRLGSCSLDKQEALHENMFSVFYKNVTLKVLVIKKEKKKMRHLHFVSVQISEFQSDNIRVEVPPRANKLPEKLRFLSGC